MRVIQAVYSTYIEFKIPSNIPLLSREQNELAKFKTPWSWYVSWGTLYYFNAKGQERSIESHLEGEPDYKRPDKVLSDDDGSESECVSESESESD